MSLKNWLLKKLSGDESATLEFVPGEEKLSGLNLKSVIDAHMDWKGKLESTLDGTSEQKHDAVAVAKDNLCVLGQWLYGPGKKLYSRLPEYSELVKVHAEFHQCAGDILCDHENGKYEQAESKLKNRFKDLSNHVQLDVVRLFATAGG